MIGHEVKHLLCDVLLKQPRTDPPLSPKLCPKTEKWFLSLEKDRSKENKETKSTSNPRDSTYIQKISSSKKGEAI